MPRRRMPELLQRAGSERGVQSGAGAAAPDSGSLCDASGCAFPRHFQTLVISVQGRSLQR